MNKSEKSNPHTTKASNTKLKPRISSPQTQKHQTLNPKFHAPKKIEEKKEYDSLIFTRNQHKTQRSETQRSTTIDLKLNLNHQSETSKPTRSTTSDLYFCFISRNLGRNSLSFNPSLLTTTATNGNESFLGLVYGFHINGPS